MSQPKREWLSLIGFLVICYLVEAAAGAITALNVDSWYPSITKPSWNPPEWVFGPVWTALYTFMGFAAWGVWLQRHQKPVKLALTLFFAQLFLNGLWSFLFFGFHWLGVAMVELFLLWCAILATILAFWQVEKRAGILLIPYLLWVSYAFALNVAIWWLN